MDKMHNCIWFNFGFIVIETTKEECFKLFNWNGMLGYHEKCSRDSVCVVVIKNSKYMRLYDRKNSRWGTRFDSKFKDDPKMNDIFSMHFDFTNDKVIWYHNNNEIGDYILEKEIKLIPAFTFYSVGDQIEIIKWQFIY